MLRTTLFQIFSRLTIIFCDLQGPWQRSIAVGNLRARARVARVLLYRILQNFLFHEDSRAYLQWSMVLCASLSAVQTADLRVRNPPHYSTQALDITWVRTHREVFTFRSTNNDRPRCFFEIRPPEFSCGPFTLYWGNPLFTSTLLMLQRQAIAKYSIDSCTNNWSMRKIIFWWSGIRSLHCLYCAFSWLIEYLFSELNYKY